MRVLAAIRLSRDQDTSTSVERQREQINDWARLKGAEVVAESVDTDVSGKVSPFTRPELGPFLRAPLVDTWDCLAFAKLDRVTRDVGDWDRLTKWSKEHGKHLVSIAEGLDLTTSAGRGMASVTAVFAQMERERIADRCRESAAKLIETGRWRGGRTPYGYQPVRCGDGYTLVQHPAQAAVSTTMADMAIDGQSNGRISSWLTREHVPTPKGGYAWTPASVRLVLCNPALAGFGSRVVGGKRGADGKRSKRVRVLVRDPDGNEVMITAEPILSRERWAELQAAMDSRGQHRRERVGGHMLLRVAYCGLHQSLRGGSRSWSPLYGSARKDRPSWYHCQVCGYGAAMDKLELIVERSMLQAIGASFMPRLVAIPGEDHTAELHTVEARIAEIEDLVSRNELPVASAARMLSVAEAERERLAALPQREPRVEYEPTSVRVSAHWETLNRDQRGQFYRQWGITAIADRRGVIVRMPWEGIHDDSAAKIAAAFGLTPGSKS